MNALVFVFSWYNLPFTFLLGVCVLVAALQLVGLGGQHDGDNEGPAELSHDADLDHDMELSHDVDLSHDLEHDFDHDLDHDLDHDIDHDLDHDLDHDVDHDVDHDAEHELGHELAPAGHALAAGGGLSFMSTLAFLGVGKAPLMVVLLILFGTVGALGWLLNGLTLALFGGGYPLVAFGGVVIVGFAAGGVISSRVTLLIARALPPFVSSASPAEALVGRTGTVISPTVDAQYGQVHVRDAGGTLITIFAVTRGEAPIARGEEVVTVSFEKAQKRYMVTRSKQTLSAPRSSRSEV